MEKYDVVVVGGSCAGAAAGVILARAGKHTLIIDKAIFPRQKLCGGMITDKTAQLLQEIYHVSFEDVIDSRYHEFGVCHQSLGRISHYCSARNTLFMVNRDVFDQFFLKEAEKAGCSTHLGDGVVGIEDGMICTASGQEISADFIIGADGSHSVVRKKVLPTRRNENLFLGLEVNIIYENLKFFDLSDEIFPWVFFGYCNGGYGWIFPKSEFATVGIAGPAKHADANLMGAFKRMLAAVCHDPSKVVEEIKGHPVPLNNRFEEPGIGNIILVGDAACLVEPLTGEGIYFGVLSGSLAARAILAQGDHISIYNQQIKKHLKSIFRQARLARILYYNRWLNPFAMRKMKGNAKWCKYFLELLSGEIEYGGYFKKVLKDRAIYLST
jgi:geranylgeranyl reductase family protein